jgi:hypothetical protein
MTSAAGRSGDRFVVEGGHYERIDGRLQALGARIVRESG